MARKNNARADQSDICVFDTRTKAVMAQNTQEGVKEKVAAVREVITDRGKNEVILVLQYYDYDVERTIQAYVEDGAKEALQEWHYPGNKPPNKKKKKNKNKKDQKDAAVNGSSTAPSGEHSEKLTASAAATSTLKDKKDAGSVHHDVNSTSSHDQKSLPASSNTAQPLPQRVRTRPDSQSSQPPADKLADVTVTSKVHTTHIGGRSHQQESKQPVRPHTLHTAVQQENRPRTMSESSSVSTSGDQSRKPHAGLQRSMKDLQRQTTSLQRLKMILNEGIDKSFQGIKTCFQQLQTEMNNREVELLSDMDKVKKDALETVAMRQKKAADLKMRTDRRMNDQELLELRADIKQFVTDRKVDEDLCETKRFVFDLKTLVQQMQTFGEVVAVSPCYSQRRPSLSSIASSHDDFQSPLSSVPTTPLLSAPPVSVSSTNFTISDSSLTTQELAELQHRLQDSLKLQGLAVKSSAPRHPANTHHRGQGAVSKVLNSQTTNTSSTQAIDDAKKGRPARRRQRIREREREDRNNHSDTRTPSPTKTLNHNESLPQRQQYNKRGDSVPKQRMNSAGADANPEVTHSKRQYPKRSSPDKSRETNGNLSSSNRRAVSSNRKVPSSARNSTSSEREADPGAGGDNAASVPAVSKSNTVTTGSQKQTEGKTSPAYKPSQQQNEEPSQPSQQHNDEKSPPAGKPSPSQKLIVEKVVASDNAEPTQNHHREETMKDTQNDKVTADTHVTEGDKMTQNHKVTENVSQNHNGEAGTEDSHNTQKPKSKAETSSNSQSSQSHNGDAVILENGNGEVLVNGVNGESH